MYKANISLILVSDLSPISEKVIDSVSAPHTKVSDLRTFRRAVTHALRMGNSPAILEVRNLGCGCKNKRYDAVEMGCGCSKKYGISEMGCGCDKKKRKVNITDLGCGCNKNKVAGIDVYVQGYSKSMSKEMLNAAMSMDHVRSMVSDSSEMGSDFVSPSQFTDYLTSLETPFYSAVIGVDSNLDSSHFSRLSNSVERWAKMEAHVLSMSS